MVIQMNKNNLDDIDTNKLKNVEAVRDALETEMNLDEDVVVIGEDVAENGGVFRATEGLLDEFGGDRVMDTPLSESGIVGSAIGMASYGHRPVAEVQFMGFIYPAFDQLISHAARLRNRSRGTYTCPLVVRAPYGGGIDAPEHHSESTEAMFSHYPGLKVVMPSNPFDMKGLLIQAIRSPDPVLFLEPKQEYRSFSEHVPVDDYTVPIGEARVMEEGSDVSLFTWGAMVQTAKDAVKQAEADVELVDMRTVSPLDRETISESVQKTGRAVVLHEAPKTLGVGSEIMSIVQEECFLYQEAPIDRVTGFDTPYPLLKLEDEYLPDEERVVEAIERVMEF